MSSHDQFGSLSGGMDTTRMPAEAAGYDGAEYAAIRAQTRRDALANLHRPDEDDIAEILGLLDDDPGSRAGSGGWGTTWTTSTKFGNNRPSDDAPDEDVEPIEPTRGNSRYRLALIPCGQCLVPFRPPTRQVRICGKCVVEMVALANAGHSGAQVLDAEQIPGGAA